MTNISFTLNVKVSDDLDFVIRGDNIEIKQYKTGLSGVDRVLHLSREEFDSMIVAIKNYDAIIEGFGESDAARPL